MSNTAKLSLSYYYSPLSNRQQTLFYPAFYLRIFSFHLIALIVNPFIQFQVINLIHHLEKKRCRCHLMMNQIYIFHQEYMNLLLPIYLRHSFSQPLYWQSYKIFVCYIYQKVLSQRWLISTYHHRGFIDWVQFQLNQLIYVFIPLCAFSLPYNDII